MKKKSTAFSLLELLIVMGLIVALSAVAAPSILDLFQGRALSQAFNVLDGAFQEARSRAIANRAETAVYMSFRSHSSQPNVQVWVVDGGDNDVDISGPLQGLTIDERDQTNALGYDDKIINAHELSPTVFLHGLASDIGGGPDSALGGDTGYFTRWYCVFRADGTAVMVMPDDDTGFDGQASNWQQVNDYLPLDFDVTGSSPGDDLDITLLKIGPDDFEDDPDIRYDLKLQDSQDELYIHLQPSTGKLIKRRFNE